VCEAGGEKAGLKRLLSTLGALGVLATCVLAGGAPASVTPVGAMQVISRATGTGAIPHGNDNFSESNKESVSGDGRYVVFESGSDGFSTEVDDKRVNIFLRDRATDTTTLISRATGLHGAAASGNSSRPRHQRRRDARRVCLACDKSRPRCDRRRPLAALHA